MSPYQLNTSLCSLLCGKLFFLCGISLGIEVCYQLITTTLSIPFHPSIFPPTTHLSSHPTNHTSALFKPTHTHAHTRPHTHVSFEMCPVVKSGLKMRKRKARWSLSNRGSSCFSLCSPALKDPSLRTVSCTWRPPAGQVSTGRDVVM